MRRTSLMSRSVFEVAISFWKPESMHAAVRSSSASGSLPIFSRATPRRHSAFTYTGSMARALTQSRSASSYFSREFQQCARLP